jgi:hypothetical protein
MQERWSVLNWCEIGCANLRLKGEKPGDNLLDHSGANNRAHGSEFCLSAARFPLSATLSKPEMPAKPLQILLVEDDELFRLGLSTRLQQEPRFEVVAEAEDGETGIELVKSHPLDIVQTLCCSTLDSPELAG